MHRYSNQKDDKQKEQQKISTHFTEGRHRTGDLLHSGLYLPETRADRVASAPDDGEEAAQ